MLMSAFHCRQSLWKQILERWGPPVESHPDPRALQDIKLAGQAANTASMVHKLDLFCRKELSRAMQQLSTDKVKPSDVSIKRFAPANLCT